MNDLLERARAYVARRATGPRHEGDHWHSLPPRLPLALWAVGLLAFLAVYVFMFTHVHIVADTRVCELRLDDPIFRLIPEDRRWQLVTVDIYTWLTVAAMAGVFAQAYLGDHRPTVRWGLGLAICGMFRACTILLIPLCRYTRMPGTRALDHIPTLNLGFAEIPWRMFASNDLLFSGHVCELVLLLRATRSWPTPVRTILWSFQVLQIVGLLFGRGHYTVDIIVAFPIAIAADHLSHRIGSWLTPGKAT